MLSLATSGLKLFFCIRDEILKSDFFICFDTLLDAVFLADLFAINFVSVGSHLTKFPQFFSNYPFYLFRC